MTSKPVFSDNGGNPSATTSPVIWFTGLSGSGKSTLANETASALSERGLRAVVLDGDDLRNGLCRDLGFSQADRSENIRRAAEVARLFARSGDIVLAAFITPLRAQRTLARGIIGEGGFIEVFCDCPLEECAKRDPKGLYARVAEGGIEHFTGVSSRYETPENPALRLNTASLAPRDCVSAVISTLKTAQKEPPHG